MNNLGIIIATGAAVTLAWIAIILSQRAISASKRAEEAALKAEKHIQAYEMQLALDVRDIRAPVSSAEVKEQRLRELCSGPNKYSDATLDKYAKIADH